MRDRNMHSLFVKSKNQIESFLKAVEKSSEPVFLSLFCLFVISELIYTLGWKTEFLGPVWNVYVVLYTVVLWGSAFFLLLIISDWRNLWRRTGLLFLAIAIIVCITVILGNVLTPYMYSFIMGAYFSVMIYGKKYRIILYCLLSFMIVAVLIGYIGLSLGFTVDAVKPDRAYGGHSLGMLYPNEWGLMIFGILLLIWYLFLQNKKIITCIIFWTAAVFMYKYITCQTTAAMSIIFPIIVAVAEVSQEKKKNSTEDNNSRLRNVFRYIIILLPFIFFAIMLLLCWQIDWVHETFYDTPLESFAMRFVEGGYALRLNGVSFLGTELKQMSGGIVDYLYDIDMKIDSAYIAYMLLRGLPSVIITLLWICVAHFRCLKNIDYRLLIISCFMLLYCTMERPGFDVWYNFVLLYPLASIVPEMRPGCSAERAPG